MPDTQLIKDSMSVYKAAEAWLNDPLDHCYPYAYDLACEVKENFDEAYVVRCMRYLQAQKLVDLAGVNPDYRVTAVHPIPRSK